MKSYYIRIICFWIIRILIGVEGSETHHKREIFKLTKPVPFENWEFLSNEQKIRYGLFLEGIPKNQYPKKIPKALNNFRHLQQLTLSSPGIFSLAGKGVEPFKFVFQNNRKSSSRFLLYPYKFTYSPDNSDPNQQDTSKNFDPGVVFTLDPDKLEVKSTLDFIKANTSVNIDNLASLYDIDIAIIIYEEVFENSKIHLFYDYESFCSLLVSYLGKASSCLLGYQKFQAFKKKNPNKGGVALINPGEVYSGKIFDEGRNNFQLIILPDYIYGSEEIILEKLGEKGVNNINKFILNGGHILATGKSGYLLENWKIIKEGSYNITKLLVMNSKNVSVNGCQTDETDFVKAEICINKDDKSFITSTFPMIDFDGFTEVLNVESSELSYKSIQPTEDKKDTGEKKEEKEEEKKEEKEEENTEEKKEENTEEKKEENTEEKKSTKNKNEEIQEKSFPFLITKESGNGRITIINGNPLNSLEYPSTVINTILLAMNKDFIFNYDLSFGNGKNLPFPRGEKNITFKFLGEFINLKSESFTELFYYLYIPEGVEFVSYDEGCKIDTEKVEEFNFSISMGSSYLKCKNSKLEQYQSFKITVEIKIIDEEIIKNETDISIVFPILKYTINKTVEIVKTGPMKIQTAIPAFVRGGLTSTPSSFYPLPAYGIVTNNNLYLENYQGSKADEVDFITVIPLISPIVDSSNQASLISLVDFYKEYYKGKDSLPKPSADFDYIDFYKMSTTINNDANSGANSNENNEGNDKINNDNTFLIPDWDTPVKIEKKARVEVFEKEENETLDSLEISIRNVGSTATVDNVQTVLRQEFLKDGEDKYQFYKYATPRGLMFVEPEKKKIPWSRSDIFFSQNEKNRIPEGFEKDWFFTVDNYKGTESNKVEKVGPFTSSQTKEGSLAIEDLIPEEYTGVKSQLKVKNLNSDDSEVKNTTYLIPAQDINNLDKIDDSFFKNYVEFITGHSIKLKLKTDKIHLGGKIVIKLGNDGFEDSVNFPEEQPVKVSADELSFYNTTYDDEKKEISLLFKRGLMSGQLDDRELECNIQIEKLKKKNNFIVAVEIYELNFDLLDTENEYENFDTLLEDFKNVPASYTNFFKLPALEIHNKLNRTLNELETIASYAEYGVYFQELGHRTIWGSAETHHLSSPGLQAKSGSFSVISSIGISSMPFSENSIHGRSILIPGVVSSSRIEWKDIWGRRWTQPLRTVLIDISPNPTPTKNFMITTTFEILNKDNTTERILEWPSDEEVIVHFKVKLSNNYNKFFSPVICKANLLPYLKTNTSDFDGELYDIKKKKLSRFVGENNFYLAFGYNSTYGKCFYESGHLSGVNVSDNNRDEILEKGKLCAPTKESGKLTECIKNIKNSSFPKLVKNNKETLSDLTWNYSDEVNKAYPSSYVSKEMFELKPTDYFDHEMDKGYRFHMDNNLPGIDNSPSQNPVNFRPHNLIAFPIFKGVGFEMSYDKNLKYDDDYSGWWSSNLQNLDDTLLAGQGSSSLNDSSWINAKNLDLSLSSSSSSESINKNLANIYVCLFNQHRVEINPDQDVYSYPDNVYQNNIIPIIYNLTTDSPEYNSYGCGKQKFQYSPNNISKFDNHVKTPTEKDWLYFAANLRGGAKEEINVLLKITPSKNKTFEGLTKIQDGVKFLYWNPGNDRDSLLSTTSNVNIIEGSRVDFEIESKILPSSVSSFNSTFYAVYTIKDPSESKREYTDSVYTNSYGLGNAVVSVTVGGIENTDCRLNPGDYTYIKVTFINNCGFDWELLSKGIEWEGKSKNFTENDVLKNNISFVSEPTGFNFITFKIPNEIENYTEIKPYFINKNIGKYDFHNNNNPTVIKDGFETNYYYNLTIKEAFPSEYRGKLMTIPLNFSSEMFNIPSKIQHIKIPPIKFGVKSNDKVYYTLGYGKDLKLSFTILNKCEIKGIKTLNGTLSPETNISEIWNDSTKWDGWNDWKKWDNLSALITGEESGFTNITADLPFTFPIKTNNGKDVTEKTVVFEVSSAYLGSGAPKIINGSVLEYVTPRGSKKYASSGSEAVTVMTKDSPLINILLSACVVTTNPENSTELIKAKDQRIFPTDSGTLKVDVTAKNQGETSATNVNFTVYLTKYGENLLYNKLSTNSKVNEVEEEEGQSKRKIKVLLIESNQEIKPGSSHTESFYVKYSPISLRRLEEGEEIETRLIEKVKVEIKNGEHSELLTENLDYSFKIPYSGTRRETIELAINPLGSFYDPRYEIKAYIYPTETSHVEFKYSRIIKTDKNNLEKVLVDRTEETSLTDNVLENNEEFNMTDLKSYEIHYVVNGYQDNTQIASVEYVVKEAISFVLTGKGPAKEKPFPVWASVILSMIGVVFLFLFGMFIWFYLKKKRESALGNSFLQELQPEPSQKNPPKKTHENIQIEMTERPAK